MWRVDWTWRRIVPLIAITLAIWSVSVSAGKVDRAQSQIDVQVQGRRVALEVLCGGISGVEEAGQRILTGTLPPPAPPPSSTPTAVEKKIRDEYAEAYSRVISDRVIAQAGATAKNVLRPNGTIDCDALKRASSTAAQPAARK